MTAWGLEVELSHWREADIDVGRQLHVYGRAVSAWEQQVGGWLMEPCMGNWSGVQAMPAWFEA